MTDREGEVTIVLADDLRRVVGQGYGQLVAPYGRNRTPLPTMLILTDVRWSDDFIAPPAGNTTTRVSVRFSDSLALIGLLELRSVGVSPNVYRLNIVDPADAP